MKFVLFVAMGGAIGAVGRYGLMAAVSQIMGAGYPYGTAIVNVLGSFILGALLESASYWGNLSDELRFFLVVGVLGSFTTFSTFSMDVAILINRNEMFAAGLYILSSIVLSVGAFLFAILIFRQLFQ